MSAVVLAFPSRPAVLPAEQAWGYARRQLKAGELELGDALTLSCAQGRLAMEVLGLAVVGMAIVLRHVAPGIDVGEVALNLARINQVAHHHLVSDLSVFQIGSLQSDLDGYATAERERGDAASMAAS